MRGRPQARGWPPWLPGGGGLPAFVARADPVGETSNCLLRDIIDCRYWHDKAASCAPRHLVQLRCPGQNKSSANTYSLPARPTVSPPPCSPPSLPPSARYVFSLSTPPFLPHSPVRSLPPLRPSRSPTPHLCSRVSFPTPSPTPRTLRSAPARDSDSQPQPPAAAREPGRSWQSTRDRPWRSQCALAESHGGPLQAAEGRSVVAQWLRPSCGSEGRFVVAQWLRPGPLAPGRPAAAPATS